MHYPSQFQRYIKPLGMLRSNAKLYIESTVLQGAREVTENERATTNGLIVMADNIPRSITASISGEMMTLSDFYTPFLATTIAYFIASSLFFIFFRKAEKQAAATSTVAS